MRWDEIRQGLTFSAIYANLFLWQCRDATTKGIELDRNGIAISAPVAIFFGKKRAILLSPSNSFKNPIISFTYMFVLQGKFQLMYKQGLSKQWLRSAKNGLRSAYNSEDRTLCKPN